MFLSLLFIVTNPVRLARIYKSRCLPCGARSLAVMVSAFEFPANHTGMAGTDAASCGIQCFRPWHTVFRALASDVFCTCIVCCWGSAAACLWLLLPYCCSSGVSGKKCPCGDATLHRRRDTCVCSLQSAGLETHVEAFDRVGQCADRYEVYAALGIVADGVKGDAA